MKLNEWNNHIYIVIPILKRRKNPETFERLIKDRLEWSLEMNKTLQGFRKKRNTMDGVVDLVYQIYETFWVNI